MYDVYNYRFAEETKAVSRERLEEIFKTYNSIVCKDEDLPIISSDHEIIIQKIIDGKSDNEPDISRFEYRLNVDKKEALHILTRAILIAKVNRIYGLSDMNYLDTDTIQMLNVEIVTLQVALYIIRNSTVRRITTNNERPKMRSPKRIPRY